jgi:hypothetical protein
VIFVVTNATVCKDEVFVGVLDLGMDSCQKDANGCQLDSDHLVDNAVGSVLKIGCDGQ